MKATMESSCGRLVLLAVVILKAECQLLNFLSDIANPTPNSRNLLQSFASQVPKASQNTAGSSRFPEPQPPQVLMNAFKLAPPQGASRAPNPLENLMSMFGAGGSAHSATGHGRPSAGSSIPVTASVKVMVNKWATQLGHKAYYEAHGCVDPMSTLHGRQSGLAGMALMMGCNNYHAGHVCDMAQMAHTGSQGAGLRTMMEAMMAKDMKHMLEECLTPSTVMKGVFSMPQQQSQTGITPPPQALTESGSKGGSVDCSSISQMLMMSAAAEGVTSLESLEQIGMMRNRYFKMTCQENMILGSLPYRVCCPGHVKPPTMEEAMMVRSMTAV